MQTPDSNASEPSKIFGIAPLYVKVAVMLLWLLFALTDRQETPVPDTLIAAALSVALPFLVMAEKSKFVKMGLRVSMVCAQLYLIIIAALYLQG